MSVSKVKEHYLKMQNESATKLKEKEKLEADIEAFLAAGGEIEVSEQTEVTYNNSAGAKDGLI
jgi:hypothetical protein